MSVFTCCMFLIHRPFLLHHKKYNYWLREYCLKVELIVHRRFCYTWCTATSLCRSFGCYHSRWFCFVVGFFGGVFWIHITGYPWLLLLHYFKRMCAGCNHFLHISNMFKIMFSLLNLVFLLDMNADFHCRDWNKTQTIWCDVLCIFQMI